MKRLLSPRGGLSLNQEIQNLLQTYQRSLNEADVDLVRVVYADDAIFNGHPIRPTAPLRWGIHLPAKH